MASNHAAFSSLWWAVTYVGKCVRRGSFCGEVRAASHADMMARPASMTAYVPVMVGHALGSCVVDMITNDTTHGHCFVFVYVDLLWNHRMHRTRHISLLPTPPKKKLIESGISAQELLLFILLVLIFAVIWIIIRVQTQNKRCQRQCLAAWWALSNKIMLPPGAPTTPRRHPSPPTATPSLTLALTPLLHFHALLPISAR